MEVEKRSSKGGFLNFFDWGGKSRKKLFSNHSDVPDGHKKGKEIVENSTNSQFHMLEYDDNRSCSSRKGGSEYNCASSVTSDEGYRSEAPGVVARLMGLDSMPTSNVCEPCSTSFIGSHSIDSYHGSNTNSQSNYHIMDYHNMYYKLEGFSTNRVESTPKKVPSRPIEKFKTEMLPPKSAKTIPVTHHKLLSPIKSPGFIPTKNAAYIMEAASKIIESSPRTLAYGKMPSSGYSSVSFKIRDMKEKMEAAHKVARPPRPKESDAVKHIREQMQHKNINIFSGPEHTRMAKIPKDVVKSSSAIFKDKGKSVSLAEQAKTNVQKREGSASSCKRTSMSHKESNGVKSKQSIKSIQSTTQKSGQKRTTTNRPSNVLQQNGQKQNNLFNKDNNASRNMVSNQPVRKSVAMNGSVENKRPVNRVAANSQITSRKKGFVVTDTGKELSSSKTKNIYNNKYSVGGGNHSEGSISGKVLIKKDGTSIQCNAVMDGCVDGGLGNRKDSMDIVSFTFSSPIKKSMSGSQSSGQGIENSDSLSVNSYGHTDLADSKFSKSPSLGFHFIGGDGLSILLEQKLKELTYKIESSQCNVNETQPAGISSSSLQDSVSSGVQGSSGSVGCDESYQNGPKGNFDNIYDSDCSSIDNPQFKMNQEWQGFKEVEEHSSLSEKSECSKELDLELLTPVSYGVVFFSNGSCSSSESRNDYSGQGDQLCSSAQSNEVVNVNSGEESCSQPVECEMKLSTAASSSFTANIDRKNTVSASCFPVLRRPTNWEMEYVRDILSNSDLMVEDLALGQADNIITPNLFDHLENQERTGEESSKIERKILFDCVSESIDLRFKQLAIGHCQTWSKFSTLPQSKGLLAEDLYKEISNLRSMEDLMVDEIVDWDMSTRHGRWVDFEFEALEEGAEIENVILFFLVDELVADLLI